MTTKIISAKVGTFTNHIAHITVNTNHLTSCINPVLTKRGIIICGKSIPLGMRKDYDKRAIDRFIDRIGFNTNYCDTLRITKEDILEGMPIL